MKQKRNVGEKLGDQCGELWAQGERLGERSRDIYGVIGVKLRSVCRDEVHVLRSMNEGHCYSQ